MKADIMVDTNRDGYITIEGAESDETLAANSEDKNNILFASLGISTAYAELFPSTYALRTRDSTSPSNPFVFWLNDDYDIVSDEDEENEVYNDKTSCGPTGDTAPEYPNLSDGCVEMDLNNYQTVNGFVNATNSDDENRAKIESIRDLEDFVSLRLVVKPYSDDRTVVKLRANGVAVNIFEGKWADTVDEDGSLVNKSDEYLTSYEVGVKQVDISNLRPVQQGGSSKNLYLPATEAGSEGVIINKNLFKLTSIGVHDQWEANLIFEAVDQQNPCRSILSNSWNCYIELIIYEPDENNQLVEVGRSKLHVDFRTVTDLYDHYTVAQNENHQGVIRDSVQQLAPTSFEQRIPESFIKNRDQYIMFVHGWRLQGWERKRFAETAFKRLYWQGYKGRFGFFSWPTLWATLDDLYWTPLSNDNILNYDNSEEIARRSAPFLYHLLADLRQKYPRSLNIVAHSMGNVVTSEALRLGIVYPGTLVDTYVPSQAAEVASAYNPSVELVTETLEPYVDEKGLERNRIVDVCEPDEETGECDEPELIIPEPDKFTYSSAGAIRNPDPVTASEHNMRVSSVDENGNRLSNHYYRNLSTKAAGQIVAFTNPDDSALATYDLNQDFKPKPFSIGGWNYRSTWTGVPVENSETGTISDIRITDQFCSTTDTGCGALDWATREGKADILAHIIQARSRALGTYSIGVGGEITRVYRMDEQLGFADDGFHHSAQFLSNNTLRRGYWEALMNSFGLVAN